MPRGKIKILGRPPISWEHRSLLAILYLLAIQLPSQPSNQMVEAFSHSPFRFRFAPQSSSAIRAHNLIGSHDRKLLSALYSSSDGHAAMNKRSYADLQCRGIYNPSIFARLERVCEDCYNLYKDDEVLGLCRADCFGSDTFRECLQSLLLEQESEFYMELVEIIGKKKK